MKTRIISGIVLGIIIVSSVLCGGYYLYLLCLGISLAGMYELYKTIHAEWTLAAMFAYLAAVAYYICIQTGHEELDLLIFVLAVMAIMTVYVLTFPKYRAEQITLLVFGIFYVAVMLSYIYKVRLMKDGIYVVWLIFIGSWINDTCAYFTGVRFGRHKMAPKLSPKKSIEGAIGGIAGATLIGLLYGVALNSQVQLSLQAPLLTFTATGLIGAFFGIVGDLAASAIKRNYGIKDYGWIIPGHGGILDRFDSVIFTAPAVFWAVYFVNMIVS